MTTNCKQLLEFLDHAPTPFHVVQQFGTTLAQKGATRLRESSDWGNLGPGSYYVKRNDSSIIAFGLGTMDPALSGLRMFGAHNDSPGLKIKPRPMMDKQGVGQLGVEVYGSPILSSWQDRDLSIAGQVTGIDEDNLLITELVDFKYPIATIPNLAIHLQQNQEHPSINRQNELLPIAMMTPPGGAVDFHKTLIAQLQQQDPETPMEKVLDHELFCYDYQAPNQLGLRNEFLSGSRLDNLIACHALLKAVETMEDRSNWLVFIGNHEEVGSQSSGGASGSFLTDTLSRLLPDPVQRLRCLSCSIFISVDNAHGMHPSYADKYDLQHAPQLNQGPVIKFNANQRYATSAVTAAFWRLISKELDIPVQAFTMNNTLRAGSTIGPLVGSALGVKVLDVGLPTLAMHSIRETVGCHDIDYLYDALQHIVRLPVGNPAWLGIADR